ncbi:hypothetical protein GCM10022407_28840 [Hymenobacter antarcticus]|uniref:Outer membrane protein beta-barrel family protein n=1 Tax=Hymenobacter antarcticus TaxID=486270 RepID=A0ABP7QG67_9BACT
MAGCVVYQPTQCAAPQITGSRQSEITASTYLNSRYELSGTYSPLPHLLVRASTGSLRNDSRDTRDSTYYRGHHYDFGLGTYWRLGSRWVVGGLGGFGQARNEAAYSIGGFILSYPTRYEFDARYNKLFGEVYGIFQTGDVISLGAAYRITQVRFTTLTDQRTPVDLSSMTRSEPMLFMRVRLGNGPFEDRPVQLQAAWGTSATFGYDERNSQTIYAPGVRELKQGRGYTTVGITIFPHCLFRKVQPGGNGR